VNVIDAHLVGNSKTAESYIVPFHGVISARGYQRISLKDISSYLQIIIFQINYAYNNEDTRQKHCMKPTLLPCEIHAFT